MSKRRRRRRDRDDAPDISSVPQLRSRLLTDLIRPSAVRSFLQDIEDRREFHPEPFTRPAQTIFKRSASRLVQHDPNVNSRSSKEVRPNVLLRADNLRFSDPTRVAVCVRRHQRREVLHAMGRVGRGSSSLKKGKWSEYSSISCKRK